MSVRSPPGGRRFGNGPAKVPAVYSMIPKSGHRFSEKIMLQQ